MTEIDWIIIAVLALSTIVGIMRGVLREVLAIAGWVAGIFLAMNYSAVVAEHIPLESIGWLPRVIIAAVLIVVACLFVVGLLSAIIRRLLETAALRFEDRALGAVLASCAALWLSAPVSSFSVCPLPSMKAVCGSSPC